MAYVPHTPLLRRLHSETMMTMGHATWTSRPREDEFEFERSSPFSAVTLSPLNKLRGLSRQAVQAIEFNCDGIASHFNEIEGISSAPLRVVALFGSSLAGNAVGTLALQRFSICRLHLLCGCFIDVGSECRHTFTTRQPMTYYMQCLARHPKDIMTGV